MGHVQHGGDTGQREPAARLGRPKDDQSHSVESYLEVNSKCYNPDWEGADHTCPDYPSSMEIHLFFRASYCKLVFQVDSRNEWLGLDDGERLGNVICSEYDYSECYKDRCKIFYAYDDMDAYRTRWAYCTWITGLPGQLPVAG